MIFVLIQMFCDKNYKCRKESQIDSDLQNLNQKKNKKELNTCPDKREEEVIVCQPNCSNHHKKRTYDNSHSCCPDHFDNKAHSKTQNTSSPSFCNNQQVKFKNQTSSLRFSPSFNLKSNKKSTPLPSCQKKVFQNTTGTSQNCSQLDGTTNSPSSFETAVNIESTSNFDRISNASFHSA